MKFKENERGKSISKNKNNEDVTQNRKFGKLKEIEIIVIMIWNERNINVWPEHF